MTWYKLKIDESYLRANQRIINFFNEQWHHHNKPKDAALFINHSDKAEEPDETWFYFSPESLVFCEMLLITERAIECEQPSPSEVRQLAGDPLFGLDEQSRKALDRPTETD